MLKSAGLIALVVAAIWAQVPSAPTGAHVNATLVSVSCTSTLTSGQSVSSAITSASAGATICLGAGSYSGFTTTASKASQVVVRATPGVSASAVTLGAVNFGGGANHLTLSTLTVAGFEVGTSSTAATNITLSHLIVTSDSCINNPTNTNQNTLVEYSTFASLSDGCNEGRLGVRGNNITHSVSSGVVIQYNVFGPAGCSDGIQVDGDIRGVVIQYNEFKGIVQGSCSPKHVDPLQFYGSVAQVITGNYFHDNTTGIMSPDCAGQQGTYTDNVFISDGGYPDQIMMSGANAGTYSHNTFVGASIRFGNPNSCGLATNATVTNNIIRDGLNLTEGQSTSSFTISHNNGVTGGTTISGTPTFVGGSTPSTWAGFALSTGSVGKSAASDGGDIGARYFGS